MDELIPFSKNLALLPAGVLKDFLGQHPEELKKSLKCIIPNNLWDSLGVEDWSWTAGLLNEKDGVLSKAELQLLNDLRELRAVEDECIKNRSYEKANTVKRTINTLLRRDLLGFLSQHNVIPNMVSQWMW